MKNENINLENIVSGITYNSDVGISRDIRFYYISDKSFGFCLFCGQYRTTINHQCFNLPNGISSKRVWSNHELKEKISKAISIGRTGIKHKNTQALIFAK